MYNQLDVNQGQEQAGFRKGRSTIDQIFIINQLLEKSNEYKLPLYILLIDFQKAFDSVHLSYLWNALNEQGIQAKYIKILRNIYKIAEGRVKTDKVGQKFRIKKGVKQGDPLSPNLFNCILESVFRKLNWGERGVEVDGVKLSNLRFADDVALIAQNKEEIQQMAEELKVAGQEAGLLINTKKTVLLSNNMEETRIILNGEEVARSDEAIYLGQIIAVSDSLEREVKRRKAKAWGSYWRLKNVFKGKFSQDLKKKIFESCVLPVLTYGAQSWALTERQLLGLARTQIAMERSMIGVRKKDRVRHQEVEN
ncbi:unnamed protein product [Brugia timori]|uniref:Reverse transcriptase domain-containing protein n=1 Tax=Brugia timori TaxID=42155 RepID=A0A0R3QIP3_9BILA|nr:unnamed protein product [Brugia timori]